MSCASCRRQFNSAWSLINHVQADHGLRVYAVDDSRTPTPPTTHVDDHDHGSPLATSSSTLSPGRELYSPLPPAAGSTAPGGGLVVPASPTADPPRAGVQGGGPLLPPAGADSCAERLRQLAYTAGSLLGGAGGGGSDVLARWCHVCQKQLGDTVGLLEHWNEAHAGAASLYRLLAYTNNNTHTAAAASPAHSALRFHFPPLHDQQRHRSESGLLQLQLIGPIPWGHSGPLCHALSSSLLLLLLLLSWTSHVACGIAIAGVRLATPGDWQCYGGSQ